NMPPLSQVKMTLRHEATHVWQMTTNIENLGLLSDATGEADPDYPLLKEKFADYYETTTSEDVLSEAVAYVVSGDWSGAGFDDKEQALRFIDRFFKNVVQEYGSNSLDNLRLAHPGVMEVIEDVRRTATKDVGSVPNSDEEGTGAGGKARRS